MSALHFDAVITANRSLSKRGLKILLCGLIGLNLLVGGFFLAIGAVPVPFFLGIDVLGVLIAFQASNRRTGQRERVQVSAEEVRVQNELGEVVQVVWRSPTAFTRVEVEGKDRSDTRVRLALSGRSRVIGRALSPGERIELADALQGAIRSARAERYPVA